MSHKLGGSSAMSARLAAELEYLEGLETVAGAAQRFLDRPTDKGARRELRDALEKLTLLEDAMAVA